MSRKTLSVASTPPPSPLSRAATHTSSSSTFSLGSQQPVHSLVEPSLNASLDPSSSIPPTSPRPVAASPRPVRYPHAPASGLQDSDDADEDDDGGERDGSDSE